MAVTRPYSVVIWLTKFFLVQPEISKKNDKKRIKTATNILLIEKTPVSPLPSYKNCEMVVWTPKKVMF